MDSHWAVHLSTSHAIFTMKSTCAFAVVLLLHSSVFANSERPHLSSDPQVNEARMLLQNGRFNEALLILRPLAPKHPDFIDVHFLIGLAALRHSQLPSVAEEKYAHFLDEAIMAFRAILIRHPGLVRVRLELARAFFLKGEDSLARRHFEHVLAGRPSPVVAAKIRRFLDLIRDRRRWSSHFGFSLAPDSNINAASDSDIIYIHGLPFRRDSESGASSGVGVILWGGSEYQHPINKRLRLRIGANATRREYAGKDFDQTFLAAHAGPLWQVGPHTRMSLLASARRLWTGGAPYRHEVGTRIEIERRLTRRLTASAQVSWHKRKHRKSTFQDGVVKDFAAGTSWVATPTIRVNVLAGYSYEHPMLRVWRNTDRWVRLGADFALPYGFTLGVSGEQHKAKYEGNWFPFTPDGTPREDKMRIWRVSVLNRAFTLYGFSPQLTLVGEERESNAQLYDYKRERAELRMVRQF